MRDPKRIDVVLDYVRKHWKENPDLRLTQLIENIAYEAKPVQQESMAWLYNMEDDLLIEAFKEMYPPTGMLDIENKKEIGE